MPCRDNAKIPRSSHRYLPMPASSCSLIFVRCTAKPVPNRADEPSQEGCHETTNNRMELSACIRAFEYVAEQSDALRVQRVIIVTDSLYVYEKYNRAVGWRKNAWKSLPGRPIENADLWKRFLTVRSKASVRTEIHREKRKQSPVLKRSIVLRRRRARTRSVLIVDSDRLKWPGLKCPLGIFHVSCKRAMRNHSGLPFRDDSQDRPQDNF